MRYVAFAECFPAGKRYSLYSRLLFPLFSRYRCSVRTNPTFLRSLIALLVVDSESFRSLEMVGIDGQQIPSLLARSARYLYTEIALWDRSIRYSSVKLRISFPPVQVGLYCPTCFSSCFQCRLFRHRCRFQVWFCRQGLLGIYQRILGKNRFFQFCFPGIMHRAAAPILHLQKLFEADTPLKNSFSLVFMRWIPVFITTKLPLGMDFNSSADISGRSII